MAVERGAKAVAADFYAISKPRILYLLLVVAWSAMFVAQGGLPGWKPLLAVTIAGAASTAAAGALNHVVERKKDAKMARTADRPVASGRLGVPAALVYSAVMAVVAYIALAVAGLHLAAWLNVGAIAYYVIVYTVILKPTTPQNIVIGGFAGSFPALIGWTAITGSLAFPDALPAYILATLVFLWTPPHFWALALLYKEDYAKADYPMMPNVRGEESTRRQIIAYSVLTFAFSLVLVAVNKAGWIYLAAALALGYLLVTRAVRMHKDPTPKRYRSFFLFSIMYLGFLLIALIIDRVVPLPPIF